MGTFAVPASPKKRSREIETFRGIDLNNSPSNVDITRSPSAPNMIRDQVGKVRKRMGYATVATAAGAIYGVHKYGEETLVHAGTKLYRWDGAETLTEIGTMAAARSRSFVFDNRLYLLDGAAYQVYDGTALTAVAAQAKVPMILIGKKPTGGGTAYEALNLLSDKWTESFLSDASSTVFQLAEKDLNNTAVTAEVLNTAGDWVKKTEGTHFTVDRGAGTVTFSTAPGAPPVTGHDNVRITAAKDREDTRAQIDGCRVFAVFGVDGKADRVFLSGNPSRAGYDWYSAFEDPTYFPVTGYTRLTRDGSGIVGYSMIGPYLATFLSGAADGRNVVLRLGSLDSEGEAVFKTVNTMLGESAAAPDAFSFAGKEPVFLTSRGVYAITAEELTGEKYTQERSYFIASAVQEAANRELASACLYNDFYVLALDGNLYFLDIKQKSYEQNTPYSSYQFECYCCPDIPADVVFTDKDALCFGTADGRLCRFHTNVDDPNSYNDDGEAIKAYWETGDFDGDAFFHNKTFTGVSCRLAAAVLTGVKVYAQYRGLWRMVFDAKEKARYFDWSYIDFSKFVFSADRTPRTLWGKIKLKKADKVRFRLQNSEKNEPFGLYAFGVEWKEPGSNYKR